MPYRTNSFLFSIIISLFIPLFLIAQNGNGYWRSDHLPYNEAIDIEQAENLMYVATPYALFKYDREEASVQRMTKMAGLSDVGVSTIAYHDDLQKLFIGYSNGNLDIVKSNTIKNIPHIKNFPIVGNTKDIYNIIMKDDYAYLSCGFGIVVIDVDKEEVKDTYYIIDESEKKIPVFDLTYDMEYFYAATNNGIYVASVDHPNLADFSAWTNEGTAPDPSATYNVIHNFDGMIFTNKLTEESNNDTIFYSQDGQWKYFDTTFISDVNNITSSLGELIICYKYKLFTYDQGLNQLWEVWTINNEVSPNPNDALFTSDGLLWMADGYSGLAVTKDTYNYEIIHPNGPGSEEVFDMDAGRDNIWVVPGSYDAQYINEWKSARFYKYVGGSWSSYGSSSYPALDSARDFVVVAIDPLDDNHVYVGSWFKGVYEFLNGEVKTVYGEENSSLGYDELLDPGTIKVGGLAFDDNHNLWITNARAENVLSVKWSNGEWEAFDLGSTMSGIELADIMVDSYNQKWMITRNKEPNPYPLVVFNENNSGQQIRKLNSSDGLPGSTVQSFVEDRDGRVWIGTDEGVGVFYSPGQVLTGDENAEQVLVVVGGYAQYLLDSEVVTAIAVDGANRKWFGTDRAGVFLMSADGTEEILHFNTSNSPLLSNSIIDIAINDNGEVFFGTANGIISYQSDASVAGVNDLSDVYAYPNPVRESYSGNVYIDNVPVGSSFKVTDISGNVVFESRANGSRATWRGVSNFSGERVKSGVYLIFVSNDDGTDTEVTKVLVMN